MGNILFHCINKMKEKWNKSIQTMITPLPELFSWRLDKFGSILTLFKTPNPTQPPYKSIFSKESSISSVQKWSGNFGNNIKPVWQLMGPKKLYSKLMITRSLHCSKTKWLNLSTKRTEEKSRIIIKPVQLDRIVNLSLVWKKVLGIIL